MVTKQGQGKHHRECWNQVAPPREMSRRGNTSNPSCGQVRGQQLFLVGEVVNCHIISQLWERQRRWTELGKQRKKLEQTLSQNMKNTWYVRPRPHDALHSCENNVTFGECKLHIQLDVAHYCSKRMLNCTDVKWCNAEKLKWTDGRGSCFNLWQNITSVLKENHNAQYCRFDWKMLTTKEIGHV